MNFAELLLVWDERILMVKYLLHQVLEQSSSWNFSPMGLPEDFHAKIPAKTKECTRNEKNLSCGTFQVMTFKSIYIKIKSLVEIENLDLFISLKFLKN